MAKLSYRENATLEKDAKTLSDIAAMLKREGQFAVLPSILDDISENMLKLVKNSKWRRRKENADVNAGGKPGRSDDLYRKDAGNSVDAGV